MSKPKVLIQFDSNPNPSTFDSIVAIDSGIDYLLTQVNVTPENIEGMVHGAIFTRGPKDLKNTALFFGGSDVDATENIVAKAKECFFGPLKVSMMSDPNGCNTTAAAAVLCAEQHAELAESTITVLAGTGPVGQRIAQIISHRLERSGHRAEIRICSRSREKASEVCDSLSKKTATDFFQPIETASSEQSIGAVADSGIVFAAGAAGIELLNESWFDLNQPPEIAIDLNAVPPAGIAGIEVMDSGAKRGKTICYGAIGVGGLKMKIHKRCLENLFRSNDQVLEAREVYEIGRQLA